MQLCFDFSESKQRDRRRFQDRKVRFPSKIARFDVNLQFNSFNVMLIRQFSSLLRHFRRCHGCVPQLQIVRTCSTIKDEIMSRVKIVENEVDSAEIVERIFRARMPIGVDMEGIQLPKLGLVQVKAPDKNIYLFRTGINPNLFQQGGLKRLLEDRRIVKIIHASAGDCIAIYKEKVRLWPLYDTCIAHRIINHQNFGHSMGLKWVHIKGRKK